MNDTDGSMSRSASPSSQISRLPYLPGLDGMRAIAVVAVMVYHADHDVVVGWVPRRRGVLRHQRVPHHAAVDRRTRAPRSRRSRPVLEASCPSSAAAIVRAAHRPGRVHELASANTDGSHPRRFRRRHLVRQQLVPDRGRPGLHGKRGVRPAATPVVARRRGTVLPDLAGGDGPGARRVGLVATCPAWPCGLPAPAPWSQWRWHCSFTAATSPRPALPINDRATGRCSDAA